MLQDHRFLRPFFQIIEANLFILLSTGLPVSKLYTITCGSLEPRRKSAPTYRLICRNPEYATRTQCTDVNKLLLPLKVNLGNVSFALFADH